MEKKEASPSVVVSSKDDGCIPINLGNGELLFRRDDLDRLMMSENSGKHFHLMNIEDNRYLSLTGSFDDTDKGLKDGLKARNDQISRGTRSDRIMLIRGSQLIKRISFQSGVSGNGDTGVFLPDAKPARRDLLP